MEEALVDMEEKIMLRVSADCGLAVNVTVGQE